MKFSYLLLSLMLAAASMDAQSAYPSTEGIVCQQLVSTPIKATPHAPVKAPELADNQKYIGNDMDDVCTAGFGIANYDGPFKAAGFLSKSMLANFDGCKIIGMRFYLCEAIGASTAFVRPVAANNYVSDPLFSKDIKNTVAGWNYVLFDYPYTISANMTLRGLMAGYDFTQTDSYPLGVSGTGIDSGFMIYGNLDKGEGWYNLGTSYGNLMVQLLIERDGGFLSSDLSMDKVLPIKFAKAGESYNLGFYCHNMGTTPTTNATFGIAVDGTEVSDFTTEDAIGEDQVYVNNTFSMPANMATGQHQLSVYVKKVNGNAPEGNLNNDALQSTFKVYQESFPRQKQLVEQFTSQYCTYCPRGYNVLNKLTEKRNDIAWVSVHCDMGGSQIDEYTIADTYNFGIFSCQGNLPSASFNRYFIDNGYYSTIGLSIPYPADQTEEGADLLNQVLNLSENEYPTFATIDLATSYDADNRQLDVKVSGKTTADAAEMLGNDAVLTVYLTEDGLWGKQKNEGVMMNRYPHDHVLRQVLTSIYGNELNANDSHYEQNFTVTLDKKWNADNMHVIAVISRPMKTTVKNGTTLLTSANNDLWVDNTETVKLGESVSTDIQGVIEHHGNSAQGRIYNLSGSYVGKSLQTLPKGLYIKDGHKYIVK